MTDKAKSVPFKPLVKTRKQKSMEEPVPAESVFTPGLSVDRENQDNGLPWSVRLLSITSIGQTVIALGDDKRLYRWTMGQWVTR
jgi:hypothetical protein